MTLIALFFTIVYGTVSSVLTVYLVRFIDKKAHKNRP